MIELTEDLVYEAMMRAKADQDEIIEKAKEIENGSKTPRTSGLSSERTDEAV